MKNSQRDCSWLSLFLWSEQPDILNFLPTLRYLQKNLSNERLFKNDLLVESLFHFEHRLQLVITIAFLNDRKCRIKINQDGIDSFPKRFIYLDFQAA